MIVFLFTLINFLDVDGKFAGYKRKHGENFKKHQHEATESFVLPKTPNLVPKFLGYRWEAAIAGWVLSFWLKSFYSYAIFPGASNSIINFNKISE